MKIKPGTQRVVSITGQGDGGVLGVLQGWIDDGWKCVALTYLGGSDGETIAVIEAGDACKDEPDEDEARYEEETADTRETEAENANPDATDDGWNSINSVADLSMRYLSDPTMPAIDLRSGPPGGGMGIVRIRAGTVVTIDQVERIQDLLISVDEAHTARNA